MLYHWDSDSTRRIKNSLFTTRGTVSPRVPCPLQLLLKSIFISSTPGNFQVQPDPTPLYPLLILILFFLLFLACKPLSSLAGLPSIALIAISVYVHMGWWHRVMAAKELANIFLPCHPSIMCCVMWDQNFLTSDIYTYFIKYRELKHVTEWKIVGLNISQALFSVYGISNYCWRN